MSSTTIRSMYINRQPDNSGRTGSIVIDFRALTITDVYLPKTWNFMGCLHTWLTHFFTFYIFYLLSHSHNIYLHTLQILEKKAQISSKSVHWEPSCAMRTDMTRLEVANRFKSYTRWFKYDRDWLCVNKSQFVPVIFEPPCIKWLGLK